MLTTPTTRRRFHPMGQLADVPGRQGARVESTSQPGRRTSSVAYRVAAVLRETKRAPTKFQASNREPRTRSWAWLKFARSEIADAAREGRIRRKMAGKGMSTCASRPRRRAARGRGGSSRLLDRQLGAARPLADIGFAADHIVLDPRHHQAAHGILGSRARTARARHHAYASCRSINAPDINHPHVEGIRVEYQLEGISQTSQTPRSPDLRVGDALVHAAKTPTDLGRRDPRPRPGRVASTASLDGPLVFSTCTPKRRRRRHHPA